MNLPEFPWPYLNLHEFPCIYLNLPEFSIWVHLGSLGITLVHLGLSSLISHLQEIGVFRLIFWEWRRRTDKQRISPMYRDLIGSNKDHQRTMVDPMFMIVQSLRSFLTAVTLTAVVPIEVILPVFTWIYLILPEFTRIYLILPKFTWNYLNLPEFTWIDLSLPKFT